MKIKKGKNFQWRLVVLISIVLLNIVTVMTIYNDNMSLFTGSTTQVSKSTTKPYALSNNTSSIKEQIEKLSNSSSGNANLNDINTDSTNGNIITGSALQPSTSVMSSSQTQAHTGISHTNVRVNDTVDATNTTLKMNLTNSFGNLNNVGSFALPNFLPYYVNTSGSYNLSSTFTAGYQSIYINGNKSSSYSISLTSGNVTRIATSFSIVQTRVNISRLQFYCLISTGTSGSGIAYITGITSSKPNSIFYSTNASVSLSKLGSLTLLNVTFSTPVLLSAGNYSAVFNVNTLNKPISFYAQSDSITNNKTHTWIYQNTGGWTTISYDLFFGYKYILVNNSNQPQIYTSPQQINLTANNIPLNSINNTFTFSSSSSSMLFKSNISVLFTINFRIHYKSIYNTPSITFNAINESDLVVWNVTFTSHNITTGSSYSVVNHTLEVYNLSTNWNGTIIYQNFTAFNYPITYTNGSSMLLWNISTITYLPYVWTFSFTNPNYIQSLNMFQNGAKISLPYKLNSSDILNVTAFTNLNSSVSGPNGSLFIYNTIGNLVYSTTDNEISNNKLVFGPWSFNQLLNLNTDADGLYTLDVQWMNTNQTEVGFADLTFELFMQTKPLLTSTNATLYVQYETLSLTVNYLSAYNNSNLNLANLTYITSWGSADGVLTQSSNHGSYVTDISTDTAINGSNHITVFASLGGYVNRSISIPVRVVYKFQTSAVQSHVVSGLSKLGYTQTLNLFWNISYNNSLVTNPTYALMLNNTLITNYHADGIFPTNSTSGNSFSLQLKIDFDPVVYNFTRGLYNYTVSFSNRFLIGQVLSLPIFVTGYNLNLTLEYNSQLFHTSSFPITAKVTYATSSSSTIFSSSNLEEPRLLVSHTRNTVLSTYTQAPFPGSAVVGIEVSFNIGVILSNGTRTIFSTVLMTDSSGKAIYIIPQTDTALINSFSYFNVSISQSTYNEAYSYSDTAVKTGITLQTGSNSEIYFIFLLVVILILVLIIGSYSAYVFIRGRQFTTQKQKQNYYNQLMLISNIYALLVTTSSGLPILTTIKKGLSENTEITSLISGLSVGMDSFLQNFQQDFFVHLNHGSQETETNSQTVLSDETTQVPPAAINVSTVDRETFKILIASSSSFRMFVFLKEKTFAGIDTLFRSIITTLEHNLVLDDIIDDSIITPQVEKIVNSYFPLALLRTFTVDMQRFARLVAESQTTAQPSLSAEALNALKSMLIVRSGQLSGQDLTLEKSRKLFDELLQTGHLPASGTFKFEEALTILEKQLKLAPKIIFELLWTGALYDVRLFVPVTT